MKSLSETMANVATIIAAIAAIAIAGPQLKDRWFNQGAAAAGRVGAVERVNNVSLSLPQARRGNPSAKVAVIESSDFQCPFCGRHARDIAPQIEQEFVKTGRILYGFRDYPLSMHPWAKNAGIAALCAGDQGAFWPMHDDLFGNQLELGLDSLFARASKLRLDAAQFKACMDAKDLSGDIQQAQRLGINSTPSFGIGFVDAHGNVMVRTKLRGAHPLSAFAYAIDEALKSRTN